MNYNYFFCRKQFLNCRLFNRLFALILILIIFDFLGSQHYINKVMNECDVIDRTIPHAGLIFMADFDENYEILGPESIRRVNHAISLYNSGVLDRIMCVGGNRPNKGVHGSQYMKTYLISNGIPAVDVFTEDKSYDTWSNWQESARIILKNEWRNLIIISSPFHGHRIKQVVAQNKLKMINVNYSSYNYYNCQPKISMFEQWKQIHYEWLAYFAHTFIPDSVYRNLVGLIREQ